MCQSLTWCGRQCINAPRGGLGAQTTQPTDQPKPPVTDPPPLEPDEIEFTRDVENHLSTLRERRGKPRLPSKTRIGIRLDDDIVDRLRNSGPLWQTRVNAILRAALLNDDTGDI
jgi:uncharacterized protein (DUF4415 family)